MISEQQFIAATRFGLGASQPDLQAMGTHPCQWLLSQLEPGRYGAPQAEPTRNTLVAQHLAVKARNKAKKSGDDKDVVKRFRQLSREQVFEQTRNRFFHSTTTEAPFRERLVQFYSNHFTISRQAKKALAWSCVGYENEAIRSRLDGSFSELLPSVVQHPAMLIYLDNIQSIGPDSRAGKRRQKGLNENLAREILELHTLGVDGGYSQQDVIALARMLTGWTVGGKRLKKMGAKEGEFFFARAMHQPGSQRLLGVEFADDGVEQAQAALKMLAEHPATARFMATKLARHFIADEPDEASVQHLTTVWQRSGGDLPTVHRALVEMDGAWAGAQRSPKFRTPWEYLVAVYRGLEVKADKRTTRALLGALQTMNHHPFTAEAPTGWSDLAMHWASPSALRQRMEWGIAVGQKLATGERLELTRQTLLPPWDERLQTAVRRAESPAQAIGIALASPAFQWR